MSSYIFTSESVTKGHPDKVCDIISDSVLDAYIAQDPLSRVAVETVVKDNNIILVGEVTSHAAVDIEHVVRRAVREIGYDRPELGFDANTANIKTEIVNQSSDISQGVDRALETRKNDSGIELGAGDQGMVFGYATDETAEFMPLPIELAHKLALRLTEVRDNGLLSYLRPDGKTQVSVRYDNNMPLEVTAVVISAQHSPSVSQEKIYDDILSEVVYKTIPKWLLANDIKLFVNPIGRFVIGGPVGDSGLTGRKIIVDTYGGTARHGGGAFSGKDPTKVDRSAAYAARYVAKNIVAAGLAKRIEIQIAYAIGIATPVSIYVNSFGTAKLPDSKLHDILLKEFDFRPEAIIRNLNLRRPIYAKTAAYGHFGRSNVDFTWEQINLADRLKTILN